MRLTPTLGHRTAYSGIGLGCSVLKSYQWLCAPIARFVNSDLVILRGALRHVLTGNADFP